MKFVKETERSIKKLRLKDDAETKERVLGDALSMLETIKQERIGKDHQDLLRMVLRSKVIRFAAAAAIIMLVIGGIHYFAVIVELGTVAWAEVVSNVERIENFTYTLKTTMEGFPGKETCQLETKLYFSEYGIRLDHFEDGLIKTKMFVLQEERTVVTIVFDEAKYIRAALTDERLRQMYQENDPRELVKRFMSLEYTEVGPGIIEDLYVRGVEVEDAAVAAGMLENASGRLWVDVETDLPVRMELEGLASGGEVEMTMIAGDFQWDAELIKEDFDFELNIPADFTYETQAPVPETNEQRAILGLRTFVANTGGRYPSDLALMTTMRELVQAWRGKHGRKPGIEEHQLLMTVGTLCQFYSDLNTKHSEVAYYGANVTANDVDSVLMRWRVSDDNYRVILGDLRALNVDSTKLAQLERDRSE